MSSSNQPHATISAQEISQSEPERCGFLRKRGQKERLLENLHLSRHINWRQKFVAVKDGCCYCFDDEVSKSPNQAFSLQTYNRVFRHKSERAAFVFALNPVGRGKIQCFAASTEEDRKLWMGAFRAGIVEANPDKSISPSGGSYSSQEDPYAFLEIPVFEEESKTGSNGSYDSDDDDEDEEGSDDSNYDQPDQVFTTKTGPTRRALPPPPGQDEGSGGSRSSASGGGFGGSGGERARSTSGGGGSSSSGGHRRMGIPLPGKAATLPSLPKTPRPLPPRASSGSVGNDSLGPAPPTPSKPMPLPTRAGRKSSDVGAAPAQPFRLPGDSESSSAPAPRPKPKPKLPMKVKRQLSERDCSFDDGDRDAAIEILSDKQAGTCLIRKSRQGDQKVLAVMTDDGVKEFKMFWQAEQVTLDKKNYFRSVNELLEHFSKNSVPNRDQMLTRSYIES